MRVLSALLLLGCSLLGVSSQLQYTTDGTSSGNPTVGQGGWVLTGVLGNSLNPTLNFTAGNTYTFAISASQAYHPFNFSKDQNANAVTLSNLDPTFYTVSTNNVCTPTATIGGYQGNGCIVSLTIAPNAPNATIWYKCTYHYIMTAQINVIAAAAGPTTAAPTGATTAAPTTAAPTGPTTAAPTGPTTPAPTTATPTTGAPTTGPITGATLTGNSFHITGAAFSNGAFSAYIFTAGGNQYLNPTLSVGASPVSISIEFPNSIHPFGFSNISSTAAVAPTLAYFPNAVSGFQINSPQVCNLGFAAGVHLAVANATTPATTPCVITVPLQATDAGLTVFYRCALHPKMIGTINVVASGTGSSSSSSTGGKPTGSAATVTGAGLALIVALMAAIIA